MAAAEERLQLKPIINNKTNQSTITNNSDHSQDNGNLIHRHHHHHHRHQKLETNSDTNATSNNNSNSKVKLEQSSARTNKRLNAATATATATAAVIEKEYSETVNNEERDGDDDDGAEDGDEDEDGTRTSVMRTDFRLPTKAYFPATCPLHSSISHSSHNRASSVLTNHLALVRAHLHVRHTHQLHHARHVPGRAMTIRASRLDAICSSISIISCSSSLP